MELQTIWFLLLGTLLAGYAVLDGFDLGVGILYPLTKKDHDRRLFLNSIGPVWDGNEVWLVTFGGALFAAFPEVYATVFSGFYLAFMLLLVALIFRAVSIEFRSKIASPRWRSAWDFSFFASSLLATLLFGVAVGNALIGIPLNERGAYAGTFLNLIRPYPVLQGLLAVSMFAMHGCIYLHRKIPRGELHAKIERWIWHTWGSFLALYLISTLYTLIAIPRAVPNFENRPWLAGVVLVNILSIVNIPRAIFTNRSGQAFISSSITIISLIALFGAAMWPNLVTASNNAAFSLTVWNSASSQKTLKIMLGIAALGIPLVLTYTSIVYWTFRKRAEIGKNSY
jgi:cytochrome d ubiquinol oxidase subunit II